MSAATYTSIDHLGSSNDVDKLLSLWFGYNHNVKLEPYGAGSTSSENDSFRSLDETEFLEPEDPIVIVGMGKYPVVNLDTASSCMIYFRLILV